VHSFCCTVSLISARLAPFVLRISSLERERERELINGFPINIPLVGWIHLPTFENL